MGKSKRAVNGYVAELQEKKVCRVRPGANQYARTQFEIAESYWPYERALPDLQSPNDAHVSSASSARQQPGLSSYVGSVRKMFLRLSCGKRNFGPADEKFAAELAQAGVLLAVVEDALLLGEARKYLSWLNHGASEPIGSLEYFRPLIEEVQQQQQPLPAAYKEYLRSTDTKSRTFAASAGAKK